MPYLRHVTPTLAPATSLNDYPTAQGKKTYSRAASRVADAGARAFAAAVAHGAPRFDGQQRNAMVRYFVLRASAEKIAGLNNLLDEMENLLAQSSDGGEEIQLTLLLSPLPSRASSAK